MAERRRPRWELWIDGASIRVQADTWRQEGEEFYFFNRLGEVEEEVARFRGTGRGNIRKLRE
ncbi:MAG: hypothetical protein ACRD2W_24545 [Acidimicrobiales bacterium]